MIVYVITEGSYSDYHIVGVTLDKKTAKQFVKNRKDKSDNFEIEEYDTGFIKEVIEKQAFFVRYDIEANRYSVYDQSVRYCEKNGKVFRSRFVYHTDVFADNEQEALKIGKDRIIPVLVRDGILEGPGLFFGGVR